MNRRDINSINDIFSRVMSTHGSSYLASLMESAATTNTGAGDASTLYSYGPEGLRINHFTKNGALNSTATFTHRGLGDTDLLNGDNIVVFLTKKVSDNENDVLHNASGPAVIFEQGGEGNEFFFLDGEPATREEVGARSNALAAKTNPKVQDTFGKDEDPFDIDF